ncbi:hypothetical protein [Leifsonia aquatica]|uniref:hypothetical protein n=1 Tax=Leifsonia aquatica TaxID=144185 RepID=UPI00382231C9
MNIATKLQHSPAATTPMAKASLQVRAVSPVTATPVIAGAAALLGVFGIGFGVGQATARG